jgi:hypothetical protein
VIHTRADRVLINCLVAVASGFIALVSFCSAVSIGQHDGGWAYLVVMGVGALCTLLATCCTLCAVAEALDRHP